MGKKNNNNEQAINELVNDGKHLGSLFSGDPKAFWHLIGNASPEYIKAVTQYLPKDAKKALKNHEKNKINDINLENEDKAEEVKAMPQESVDEKIEQGKVKLPDIDELIKKSVKKNFEKSIPSILEKLGNNEELNPSEQIALYYYSQERKEQEKEQNSLKNRSKKFFLKNAGAAKEGITNYLKNKYEKNKGIIDGPKRRISGVIKGATNLVEKFENRFDKTLDSLNQFVFKNEFNDITSDGKFEMLDKQVETPLTKKQACALYKTSDGKEGPNGKKENNEYFMVLADADEKTKFLKFSGNLDAITEGKTPEEAQATFKKFVEHISQPNARVALRMTDYNIGNLEINDKDEFILGNEKAQKFIESGHQTRTQNHIASAKESIKGLGKSALEGAKRLGEAAKEMVKSKVDGQDKSSGQDR